MQSAARKSLQVHVNSQKIVRRNEERENGAGEIQGIRTFGKEMRHAARARVFVAAENRLLQEALSRMLAKLDDIEITGNSLSTPFQPETLLETPPDILLLSSSGSVAEDLLLVRKVRATAPDVKILLIGMSGEDTEFLQCVRGG